MRNRSLGLLFIASRYYEVLPSTLEEDGELIYLHLLAEYSIFILPPQYLNCNKAMTLNTCSFILGNLRNNHISVNVEENR